MCFGKASWLSNLEDRVCSQVDSQRVNFPACSRRTNCYHFPSLHLAHVATGFKAAYFMGMGTLFAMAINVVAIVVCLFLIAQYLEGTLHKGVHLGGTCQHFNIFLSAESAHGDGTNHWQRILASTGRLGQQNKACWQRGDNMM